RRRAPAPPRWGCPRRRLRAAVLRQEQQRGLHAAAHVGGAREVKLQEDRFGWLLDRALRRDERLRDRLVALALRDLGERLELARRQCGERRLRVVAVPLHEQLDDLRVDVRAALMHGVDRVDKLAAVVDALLEEIGAPRGPALEQAEDVRRLRVLAEHDDAHVRVRLAGRPRGAGGVGAVARWAAATRMPSSLSVGGMRMSVTTTSGRSASMVAMSVAESDTAATGSTPGASPSRRGTPSRTRESS